MSLYCLSLSLNFILILDSKCKLIAFDRRFKAVRNRGPQYIVDLTDIVDVIKTMQTTEVAYSQIMRFMVPLDDTETM